MKTNCRPHKLAPHDLADGLDFSSPGNPALRNEVSDTQERFLTHRAPELEPHHRRHHRGLLGSVVRPMKLVLTMRFSAPFL